MSVSIQDIATKVGVSKTAVSLALRNHPRISVSRREEVQRVALELGYETNLLARSLAKGKTYSIGILWGLMGGPHAPLRTCHNIAVKAQTHGYASSIENVSSSEDINQALSKCAKRRVDGVILQWPYVKPLSEEKNMVSKLNKFSAVVIVCPQPVPSHFDQVIHDRAPAMREVAAYLHRTGRTKPVIAIKFPDKANAYAFAFKQCGFEVPEQAIIREKVETLKDFCSILDKCVDLKKKNIDTIVCNNDEEAVAAISWLRSKHLRVPQDVAVIGFNDSESATFLMPPLASVARRDDELVEIVERVFFARLKDTTLPPQREVVPMSFIWRQSAGEFK
jgi:LacI family transcriptional regulator